ncbi:MAG: cydB: cytochrome d ubiquinol oxidase, subunit [Chloroflexi bacterium]|nr:cydB: cytochrome d ubiquinol oxidase, subunit [Chloroflexota bacterium]
MPTLWFVLLAFMLIMYVLLDGFDLGAGAIHLFAAKNEQERRTILRAIGPVWDGNEVWLIAAGGTLFFTFPLLYASSFSGFYLPLFIVLWLLMIRGVSIELRSHINNPIWASFWDGMFFIGSALLALVFGAALANVMRGVPLDAHGNFFAPLWTNFSPSGPNPGVLDWYTILIGLLALVLLTVHGANYIVVKTTGAVNGRARRIARSLWLPLVILTAGGTIATFSLRPSLFDSFNNRPWGYIFPLISIGGLLMLGYGHSKGWELGAFAASAATILGLMASTAFGLYPDVLPAVTKANSLTIDNASASHYALVVGLIWWLIAMVLAAIYFTITYRLFRGKVRQDETAGGY